MTIVPAREIATPASVLADADSRRKRRENRTPKIGCVETRTTDDPTLVYRSEAIQVAK
jgi:hypothetical protein